VEPFADTEFFAGKNYIARKISGFEIFTRKNFRTKKFHVRKKSGFKNSERENFPDQEFSVRKKVRHVLVKNCPATTGRINAGRLIKIFRLSQ